MVFHNELVFQFVVHGSDSLQYESDHNFFFKHELVFYGFYILS